MTTDSGIITCVNDVQPMKPCLLILVIVFGISISFNIVKLLNSPSLISLSLVGITILVSVDGGGDCWIDVYSSNVSFEIETRNDGIMICFNDEQPSNACFLIEITE